MITHQAGHEGGGGVGRLVQALVDVEEGGLAQLGARRQAVDLLLVRLQQRADLLPHLRAGRLAEVCRRQAGWS